MSWTYPGERPGTSKYEGQSNSVRMLLESAWPDCNDEPGSPSWSCESLGRVLRREQAELRALQPWRWRARRRLRLRRHLTLAKAAVHLSQHLPDPTRGLAAFDAILGPPD